MTKPVHSAIEPIRKALNPALVLGQIENSQSGPGISFDSDDASRARTPRLRVFHCDEDPFSDQLDQPLEVPSQIMELTAHLNRRRESLESRESDLHQKLELIQSSMDQRIAATASRERELSARERQLRSLQFHLLQLQSDVIDSQLSMEKIIEHFENSDSDQYMQRALELLRFEVVDRFEYVARRWETLHEKLEQLCGDQSVRKAA